MSVGRTYLDYNATAPLIAEARSAMIGAFEATGNPSSVHAEGRRARAIVEHARDQVAALVNARPSEVVFTSGATEANVWALSCEPPAVAAAAIEHDSILAPLKSVRNGYVTIPVGTSGVADVAALTGKLPVGALVPLQWANNETGVVQPVEALADLARTSGWQVHIDAVQAAGRLPVDFKSLGVATLSLSAHKMGGPKGVGALIIRDGVDPRPLIPGGGQERRRRAGTENVPAIAGFGAAAETAYSTLSEWRRVAELRDRLERELLLMTPSAEIIGASSPRLPNTSCVALPGVVAETLVIKFDLADISISAGAACSSGKVGASHVLSAMGLRSDVAAGAIRVSLGRETQPEDIARFLEAWCAISTSTVSARKKVA